ncbi:MAG: hypothetical protein KA753_04815 [Paludibacter sp.]|nr:hypothetical protein [Paludibacter sp.]
MVKEMYFWLMYFFKKIGRTEMLEFNSYLLICMLLGFNILTVLVFMSFILKFDLKSIIQDYKITGIIFGLTIVIPNYFHLFRRRKEIEKKYDQLPKKRRVIGMICFWIYSIVSIPLFFKLIESFPK